MLRGCHAVQRGPEHAPRAWNSSCSCAASPAVVKNPIRSRRPCRHWPMSTLDLSDLSRRPRPHKPTARRRHHQATAAASSTLHQPQRAPLTRERHHARLLDVAALQEASEAVESLRASLTASAAAEEAARLEVDSLRAALTRQREDDDRRYQETLRQQAETMRMHVRIGELLEAASLRNAAAESAAIDVTCIQQELAHAEDVAARLAADLVSQRAHSDRQMAALHAAREREASAHLERLGEHGKQLEKLRTLMTEEQRVDPRHFVEQLQPVYVALADGLRHETELSRTLGEGWATAEAEAAMQRAATAEARLTSVEAAKATDREARRAQQQAEREAVHASAQLHVEQMKDHVASLLSEMQEKEAASRAAQQVRVEALLL